MMSKNIKFRIGLILALTIFFSLKTFNDYRERNLVDLIGYKSSDYYSLEFTREGSKITEGHFFDWFTKDKEPTNELLEFLSQYRVKKINEEKVTANLNNEERVEFYISHSKANPAIIWIRENDVHILVGNYYKVVNGPIDMEWIKNYNEKYKELYQQD